MHFLKFALVFVALVCLGCAFEVEDPKTEGVKIVRAARHTTIFVTERNPPKEVVILRIVDAVKPKLLNPSLEHGKLQLKFRAREDEKGVFNVTVNAIAYDQSKEENNVFTFTVYDEQGKPGVRGFKIVVQKAQ